MDQSSPPVLRFGPYEIVVRSDGTLYELGRGGFGCTYLAVHIKLKNRVALKVLDERHTLDDKTRRRFLEEAREQAALDHQGIAKILDCGDDDGKLWYAVELCEEGHLKEFVARCGELNEADTFHLMLQAAEALRYAHHKQRVHLDVKPSNLMLKIDLEGRPVLKLIDFGLVQRITGDAGKAQHDGEGDPLFSPAFASPEQVLARPPDPRSDLFSLGLTAWYLLTGENPDRGSAEEVKKGRVSDEEYESRLPRKLTDAGRALLARLIRKEPAKRFASAAELVDALRKVLATHPPLGCDWRGRQQKAPALWDFYTKQGPGRRSPVGNQVADVYQAAAVPKGELVKITLLPVTASSVVIERCRKIAAALHGKSCPSLVKLLEVRQYQDGWAVVEERSPPVLLFSALRNAGAMTLEACAPLLWRLAEAVDAAVAAGCLNPSLDDTAAAGLDPGGRASDWLPIEIRLPVNPLNSNLGDSDLTATPDVTDFTMPATTRSPIQVLAARLYFIIGGVNPDYEWFYTAKNYRTVSKLGEAGNAMLARYLCGQNAQSECADMLRQLFAAEGVAFDSVGAQVRLFREKSLETGRQAVDVRAPGEPQRDRLLSEMRDIHGQIEKAAAEARQLITQMEEDDPDDARRMVNITRGISPLVIQSGTLLDELSVAEGTEFDRAAARVLPAAKLIFSDVQDANKRLHGIANPTGARALERLVSKLKTLVAEVMKHGDELTRIQREAEQAQRRFPTLKSEAGELAFTAGALIEKLKEGQQLREQRFDSVPAVRTALEKARATKREIEDRLPELIPAVEALRQRIAGLEEVNRMLGEWKTLAASSDTALEEAGKLAANAAAISRDLPQVKAEADEVVRQKAAIVSLHAQLKQMQAGSHTDAGTLQPVVQQATVYVREMADRLPALRATAAFLTAKAAALTEMPGLRQALEQVLNNAEQSASEAGRLQTVCASIGRKVPVMMNEAREKADDAGRILTTADEIRRLAAANYPDAASLSAALKKAERSATTLSKGLADLVSSVETLWKQAEYEQKSVAAQSDLESFESNARAAAGRAEPPPVRDSGEPSPHEPPRRNRKGLWITLTAAAAIIVAGGAWFLRKPSSSGGADGGGTLPTYTAEFTIEGLPKEMASRVEVQSVSGEWKDKEHFADRITIKLQKPVVVEFKFAGGDYELSGASFRTQPLECSNGSSTVTIPAEGGASGILTFAQVKVNPPPPGSFKIRLTGHAWEKRLISEGDITVTVRGEPRSTAKLLRKENESDILEFDERLSGPEAKQAITLRSTKKGILFGGEDAFTSPVPFDFISDKSAECRIDRATTTVSLKHSDDKRPSFYSRAILKWDPAQNADYARPLLADVVVSNGEPQPVSRGFWNVQFDDEELRDGMTGKSGSVIVNRTANAKNIQLDGSAADMPLPNGLPRFLAGAVQGEVVAEGDLKKYVNTLLAQRPKVKLPDRADEFFTWASRPMSLRFPVVITSEGLSMKVYSGFNTGLNSKVNYRKYVTEKTTAGLFVMHRLTPLDLSGFPLDKGRDELFVLLKEQAQKIPVQPQAREAMSQDHKMQLKELGISIATYYSMLASDSRFADAASAVSEAEWKLIHWWFSREFLPAVEYELNEIQPDGTLLLSTRSDLASQEAPSPAFRLEPAGDEHYEFGMTGDEKSRLWLKSRIQGKIKAIPGLNALIVKKLTEE